MVHVLLAAADGAVFILDVLPENFRGDGTGDLGGIDLDSRLLSAAARRQQNAQGDGKKW
jgi:hypothetical protein